VWFDPAVAEEQTNDEAREAFDPARRARRLRAATTIVACLALALFAAAAGYKDAVAGSVDIDAARAAGAAAGARSGRVDDDAGYGAGFKFGRKIGFAGSYATGYRQAFEDLFEAAGLPSPGGTAPDAPAPSG
jgi:hypothetical protein